MSATVDVLIRVVETTERAVADAVVRVSGDDGFQDDRLTDAQPYGIGRAVGLAGPEEVADEALHLSVLTPGELLPR